MTTEPTTAKPGPVYLIAGYNSWGKGATLGEAIGALLDAGSLTSHLDRMGTAKGREGYQVLEWYEADASAVSVDPMGRWSAPVEPDDEGTLEHW